MALLQRTRTPSAEDVRGEQTVPSSAARSAGGLLRQRREELGLDLGEAGAALRIKPAYLAALEAGRPDQLPGPTYAAGFARAYADHLGLDGREVLRRFKQEFTALDAKPDLSFPMPLGERSIPGGGMLLVALILALCGYGTWYYLSTGERTRPERVTEVPAALLAPTAPPHAAEAVAAPRPAVPAADVPSPEPGSEEAPTALAGIAPAVLPGAPVVTADIPSAPPPSEERRVSTTTEAPSRIFIRATAESWVQIRDTGGAVLLERVLKVGETYPVPDHPGLSMHTGNAGGLQITVDGLPAPAIGRVGAIRRNVALEPRALIAGSALR